MGTIERIVSHKTHSGHDLHEFHVSDGQVRGVRLQSTDEPTHYVIVHPSTHELGQWQVSYFDDEGAVGHTIRPTLEAALNADFELRELYQVSEIM